VQCKAAYEAAAKAYKDKGDIQTAAATLEEMKTFLAGTAPAAPTVVVIVSKWSGKAMTPEDRDNVEGTRLVQMDIKKGDPFQMWRVVPSETGFYYFENVKTGLAITVSRDARNDGAELITAKRRPGADYQLWKPVPVADDRGYFKFESRSTGKRIGIISRSRDEGGRMNIWREDGLDTQRWAVYPQP